MGYTLRESQWEIPYKWRCLLEHDRWMFDCHLPDITSVFWKFHQLGCIYVPSISGISDLDQQKPRKINGFLHVGVDFGISSNWGSHIRVCLVPMSWHNYIQIHAEYIYIYTHIMYHTESCIIKCSMYLCCADFKHFTVGWEMDLDLDISTLIISPTQPPLLMPVH